MRCDYPMGYDEDYLEPACEIFLQLFLQNAQIAGNEELSQDNDGTLNADFAGYESDDNSSFPSLHTISDGSLSSGELSGDEGESVIVLSEESNVEENFPASSFNDVLENEEASNPEIDSAVYELIDTDILSENHETSRSSFIINSENSDGISNMAFQESDSCVAITSNSLSHQNDTSLFEESSVQTDILPYDIIPSSPSTYVSLYVVVPPTNFSHESVDLLSEVSSDRLISDVTPVSSVSPSVVSDNGNSPLEEESSHNIHLCDNSEASDSSAVCSSVSEKKKNYSRELNSALHVENSISSESTIDYDENPHPTFMFDAHLSEGMSVHQDGNADCDISSDKSMSNLKRKVVSSTDDGDVINKVPKYSISPESNDSLSEISLDHYCVELSSDTEMPVPSDDDDKIEVPSAVNIENNILPSIKATEENSVTEQQTDL